ncbi:MAG: hypothetical protein H6705_16885 [Myxococcales bacterium]|nr:hypothetical protein [Myxococcales bacterium]
MRIRAGTTGLFAWDAPEPVAASPAPTLVVRIAGEAADGIADLAPVVAPASVSAVSTDLKRLTLSAELEDADRAAGERWGTAWFVTSSDGAFPVRVAGIATVAGVTTVSLADPLPRRPASASGSLQWARWTTVLDEGVTGTPRRDVTWVITWRPLHAGAAAGDATEETAEGRLIIARAPFATGLTAQRLGAIYPDLAQTVAGRDNSRAAAIDAALAELELDLAPDLAARGLWPDDIDGTHLHLAHATLTAAVVVEKAEPKRAERLRKLYDAQRQKGLRQIWADLDRDGLVDAGEDTSGPTAPVQLAPARLSDLFPGASTPSSTPRWARGRSR